MLAGAPLAYLELGAGPSPSSSTPSIRFPTSGHVVAYQSFVTIVPYAARTVIVPYSASAAVSA